MTSKYVKMKALTSSGGFRRRDAAYFSRVYHVAILVAILCDFTLSLFSIFIIEKKTTKKLYIEQASPPGN